MKLVTWNVNSLSSQEEHLAAYLGTGSPDILCLQGLNLDVEGDVRSLFESAGYHVETDGVKSVYPVAIASRSPLSEVRLGFPGDGPVEGGFMGALIDGMSVYNAFAPNASSAEEPAFQHKLTFFERMTQFFASRHRLEDRWALAGTLSVAPLPDDVWSVEEMRNQVSYHPQEHKAWACLLAVGLHDAAKPHLPFHHFTFWEGHRGMRLDHCLVSEPVLEQVQRAQVHQERVEKEKPRGHAPLVVELEPDEMGFY